jgi:hypothetical protein
VMLYLRWLSILAGAARKGRSVRVARNPTGAARAFSGPTLKVRYWWEGDFATAMVLLPATRGKHDPFVDAPGAALAGVAVLETD